MVTEKTRVLVSLHTIFVFTNFNYQTPRIDYVVKALKRYKKSKQIGKTSNS